MQTTSYTRKPLFVEAVQVTPDNFTDIAQWSGGVVRDSKEGTCIQINVINRRNAKKLSALIGDWVLKSEHGFKIYTDSAFNKGFNAVPSEPTNGDLLREHLGKNSAEVLQFNLPPEIQAP